MLLDPADRVQVEGIVQGLREGLRAEDHMLWVACRVNETTQQGTHRGQGKRHRVTGQLTEDSSKSAEGYGDPATTSGPAAATSTAATTTKGNQAPRDAGLTQHIAETATRGKSQERERKMRRLRGDVQRPAIVYPGTNATTTAEKQQRE